MPRIYQKPPLQEALVEIRLEKSRAWDVSLPGLFWERVRADFPKKRSVDVMELKFNLGKDKVNQELGKKETRFQCLTEDENIILQIGPHLFVTNFVGSYPTWPRARDRALEKFSVFHDLADNQAIAQVALRYINRITIPQSKFSWGDYFKINLDMPAPEGSVSHLALERDQSVEDADARFRTVFRSDVSNEEGSDFILDLECTTLPGIRLAAASLAEWLDKAHGIIKAVFEDSFTEKAHHDLFQEETTHAL